MTKIVGIRFRNVGKIYYFDPKNYKMKIGDHVIVETARGVEFGRVVLGPKEVGEDEVVHPLKEVLRVATQADEEEFSFFSSEKPVTTTSSRASTSSISETFRLLIARETTYS